MAQQNHCRTCKYRRGYEAMDEHRTLIFRCDIRARQMGKTQAKVNNYDLACDKYERR